MIEMQNASPNIRVVAQGVKMQEIDPKKLTTDCMTVIREDGVIDVVRAYKMVDIFDHYHDLGVSLKRILLSGGVLNPKNQSPTM